MAVNRAEIADRESPIANQSAITDRLAPEARRIDGLVAARLPSGLYQVELEGAHRITAHIGGGPDRNFIRVLVGDRVVVELTPRDLTRGRIVGKV